MKPVVHGCLRNAVMTRRLDRPNLACSLQDRQQLCRRVLPPLPRLIGLRRHLRPRWDEYPPSDRPGFIAEDSACGSIAGCEVQDLRLRDLIGHQQRRHPIDLRDGRILDHDELAGPEVTEFAGGAWLALEQRL